METNVSYIINEAQDYLAEHLESFLEDASSDDPMVAIIKHTIQALKTDQELSVKDLGVIIRVMTPRIGYGTDEGQDHRIEALLAIADQILSAQHEIAVVEAPIIKLMEQKKLGLYFVTKHWNGMTMAGCTIRKCADGLFRF